MAKAILRPRRLTDARAVWFLKRLSPVDLGLSFEALRFHIRNERDGGRLDLAAWWIPAQNDAGKCIVLVHGYADAKVGAIAWAPFLHGLGFHILALDLRAHGESGGTICTGGFWECHDLDRVLNEIRALRPAQTRMLAMFGISFGGLVVAATAAMRDDLAGIVLDSPPHSVRRAIMVQWELMGLPSRLLGPAAIRLAQARAKASFDQMQLPRFIDSIACPLMLVEAGQDAFVTPADRAGLAPLMARRRAFGKMAEYLLVENSLHALAMQVDPRRYADAVGEFLLHLPHS